MKRFFALTMLLAIAMVARAFDFSHTASTGQRLYYAFVDNASVKVVAPANGASWEGYEMPVGRLTIPTMVEFEGTQYVVAAIDKNAFSNCEGLTAVVVPSSVVSIGLRAFAHCTSLASVTLEEGVQSIATLAFLACTSLDTIVLPSTLTSIGTFAFNDTGYINNSDNWSSALTLSIGSWLIQAANTVSGEVVVEDGMLGIADNAFYSCRYLRGITLPATLQHIGGSAFQQCSVLDTVHVMAEEPPTLGEDVFYGALNVVVQVPCGALTAYSAAARWNTVPLVEAKCPEPQDSTGIGDVERMNGISVVVENGQPVVLHADGRILQVFDVMGRCIETVHRASGRQPIVLPQRGIYILRCDGESLKFSYSK